MFGLFELESRIFSPRIRDLPAQILYPMEREQRHGPLGALFRGPPINRARIRANWDEMHRIAASLQDGTVTAQLLVSKLQALKQQRGAYTGIQELGRIFKTIALIIRLIQVARLSWLRKSRSRNSPCWPKNTSRASACNNSPLLSV